MSQSPSPSHSLWGKFRSWVVVGRDHPGRRRRGFEPSPDALEGRVVLSRIGFGGGRFLGGDLSSGLAATAVTSTFRSGGPQGVRGEGAGACGNRAVRDEQLAANLQQLRTDVQAVLAGSTVTDAMRQALAGDFKQLADAGFRPDRSALQAVVDSLLTSLADGSYDDASAGKAQEIEDAFAALFAGTTVDAALIDQTYGDLVTVARNLNISADELATLAADRAAIEADLTRLGLPTDRKGPGSNLDLVLAPGFARGRGRRF